MLHLTLLSGYSGNLDGIYVFVGELYYAYSLSVVVWSGAGCSGTQLYSSTTTQPNGYSWQLIQFTPSIPVVGGNSYTITFDCTNQCGIGYTTSNPYSGGYEGRWDYSSIDSSYDLSVITLMDGESDRNDFYSTYLFRIDLTPLHSISRVHVEPI